MLPCAREKRRPAPAMHGESRPFKSTGGGLSSTKPRNRLRFIFHNYNLIAYFLTKHSNRSEIICRTKFDFSVQRCRAVPFSCECAQPQTATSVTLPSTKVVARRARSKKFRSSPAINGTPKLILRCSLFHWLFPLSFMPT